MGWPSWPSYQTYSAFWASALTRTTAKRACRRREGGARATLRSVGRAGAAAALPGNAPACRATGARASGRATQRRVQAAQGAEPATHPSGPPPRAWRRAGVPQATAWAMLACGGTGGEGSGGRQAEGGPRAEPGVAVGPPWRPHQLPQGVGGLGAAPPPTASAGSRREASMHGAPPLHLGGQGGGHGAVQSPAQPAGKRANSSGAGRSGAPRAGCTAHDKWRQGVRLAFLPPAA